MIKSALCKCGKSVRYVGSVEDVSCFRCVIKNYMVIVEKGGVIHDLIEFEDQGAAIECFKLASEYYSEGESIELKRLIHENQ